MKAVRFDSRTAAALMADSVCRPDRRMPLFVPDGSWSVEVRLAVRVGRLGKAMTEQFALRHLDAWGLVAYLKPSEPSVRADMTDDALCTGLWNNIDAPTDAPLQLSINDKTVTLDLRSVLDEGACFLSELSATATFKTGDLIILPGSLAEFPGVPGTEIKATLGRTVLLDLSLK